MLLLIQLRNCATLSLVIESEERVGGSVVQFKNGTGTPEATVTGKTEKPDSSKPRYWSSRTYRISRILRAIEFLILVVLLALTIYLIANTKVFSNEVAKILLVALVTTYLFILSVDIISRITGRALSDAPMFLFGVLGCILFAIAAEWMIGILLHLRPLSFLLLVIVVLCITESLLFLLDVTLTILNWRHAYTRVDKCPFGAPVSNVSTVYDSGDNYSQRTVWISDPLVYKDDVRHVTTSVSDYQRPSHPDLTNLHKIRKIGVGHRREYIDRPVSAQAVPSRVVEAQTEPPQKKIVSNVESLIVAETKEEPVQTVSKCPVCANHWNPHGNRRVENFGLCPTFLHLAQGFGMCNCGHQTSSVLRPIHAEGRTESTSGTDLAVWRKSQEPGFRQNSS